MPLLKGQWTKRDRTALRPTIHGTNMGGLWEQPAGGIPIAKSEGSRPGIFAGCANPECRSGWLRLWRSRSAPVFEEGWICSVECTVACVRFAVARELDVQTASHEEHRHRIPLGLLMMERGWISREQLRRALEAQKAAGTGRLGQWLIQQKATSEEMVARALGLQWSCPVVSLEHQEGVPLATAIPRLFLDAHGALPLRLAAAQVRYLGFEAKLDPVLAFAAERMAGLRVESCIVRESQFLPVHARMLEARFPSVELVEAVSQSAAARALAKSIERCRPIRSRLVRVHDCLWLRLWSREQRGPLPEKDTVQDVVCSLGPIA